MSSALVLGQVSDAVGCKPRDLTGIAAGVAPRLGRTQLWRSAALARDRNVSDSLGPGAIPAELGVSSAQCFVVVVG